MVSTSVQPPGDDAMAAAGTIRCDVWTTTNAGFIYPKMRPGIGNKDALLQSKAAVSLVLSGGGMRAAINALGWLRGLHHIGALKHKRYIISFRGLIPHLLISNDAQSMTFGGGIFSSVVLFFGSIEAIRPQQLFEMRRGSKL